MKKNYSILITMSLLVAFNLLGLMTTKGQVTYLPDPVAYYPMDATGDTIAEDVIDGANGAWYIPEGAGLSWAEGKFDNAAGMGGENGQFFLINKDPLVGAEALTISLWCKTTQVQFYKGIFGTRNAENGNQWAINQNGAKVDTRSSSANGGYTAEILTADEWHHIAMTWNSEGIQKTYLNGELVQTSTTDNDIPTTYQSNGRWLIGMDPCCSGREFKGMMDDIAMWATELNGDEVKFAFDQGVAGMPIGKLKKPVEYLPKPVAYYPMDATADTIAVDVINGANGGWMTPGGTGLTWEAGKLGNAATLAGGSTHSFHISSDPLVGAEEFTIVAWMKASALKAQGGIITSRGSQYQAMVQEGTHVDYRVNGAGGMDSPEDLVVDTWYHVALTKDMAGVTYCYLNGQQVFSNSIPSAYVSNGHWEIGIDDCCGGIRAFKGQLDDIAMFNIALSPEEVLFAYEKGEAGTPIGELKKPVTYLPEPVAYYPMDAIDDTIAEDVVSGANGGWNVPGSTGLSWGQGKIGNAAVMSGGAGQFFKIDSDPIVGAEELTISLWMNTAQVGSYKGVFGNRNAENGNQWAINHSGVRIDTRSNSKNGGYINDVLTVDTWYHVAMTWNAKGEQKTYVNGELMQTSTAAADQIPSEYISNGLWLIGMDPALSDRAFKGKLDEIALFKVELSKEEIMFMYEQTNGGNPVGQLKDRTVPKPKAYYPMDATEDTIAVDAIGDADGGWYIPESAGLTWAEGKLGNAAVLGGGGGQFFKVDSDPIVGAEELTISLWMNPAQVGGYKGVFGNRNAEGGNQWAINHSGVRIDTRSNSKNGGYIADVLEVDKWYHVVMTWKSTGVQKTYVNGELVQTSTAAADEIPTEYVSNGLWLIGMDPAVNDRSFKGQLDEIVMFNKALGDFHVKLLYDNGNAGIPVTDYVTEEEEPLSDKTDLYTFELPDQVGSTVIGDDDTVRITVMANDISSLVPSKVEFAAKAKISPEIDVAQDFSGLVEYTVTAENNDSMATYVVMVEHVIPSKEANIDSLEILEDFVSEVMFEDTAITVLIARPANLAALTPRIVISENATVSPASGQKFNFLTDTLYYTVTAEDVEVKKEYSVIVKYFPNTVARMTSFAFEGIDGEAHIVLDKVNIVVPRETDLTSLKPLIGLADGASVDPESGTAGDFSGDVKYTVTSEDGLKTMEYTVIVKLEPNTEAVITGFTMPNQVGETIIDAGTEVIKNIKLMVSGVNDLTTLTPEIVASEGATITPNSGTVQDFSSIVLYIVTAEDGVKSNYYYVQVTLDDTPLDIVYSNKSVVFPNPASNRISVSDLDVEKIQIYNLTGALQLEKHNVSTVEIGHLSEGVYMVKVYSKGVVYNNKLIVK